MHTFCINNSARTVVETQQQKTPRSSSFRTGSGRKIDVVDGPEFWKDQTQFQTQPDMGQRIVSKWKARGNTCVTLRHRRALRAEFESEQPRGERFTWRPHGKTWQTMWPKRATIFRHPLPFR
jgi:hypothetical protein